MEAILLAEFKNYARYTAEESPYNLLDCCLENELIPMAKKFGLGIFSWGALTMGVLVGRYEKEDEYPEGSKAAIRRGFYADRVTTRGIATGIKFVKLAMDAGTTPDQLAVPRSKDQPGITATLTGPRTLEHLEDMLPVLNMILDDSLREACDSLVPPGSTVANFHNTSGWMKGQII